jgi:hypothetical protein
MPFNMHSPPKIIKLNDKELLHLFRLTIKNTNLLLLSVLNIMVYGPIWPNYNSRLAHFNPLLRLVGKNVSHIILFINGLSIKPDAWKTRA